MRYLATAYDEVWVVCKQKYAANAAAMYADDSAIKLLTIEDDIDLHPWHVKRRYFEEQGFTVYSCGFFAPKPDKAIYNLPQSFYDDLGIPHEVRNSYFFVPRTEEAARLAAAVRAAAGDRPYTVVHQQSSVQKLRIYEALRAEEGGGDRLILDLNENHYAVDHPDWAVAESVVNKPLVDYTFLLEGAAELHMIESSIYCLASHLDLSGVIRKVCYEPWGGNAERLGIFTTGVAEKVPKA